MTLDVVYFAVGGLILEVTGLAPEKGFESWSQILDEALLSIRPPTASEVAALREERLRTTKARAGETLDKLVKRTDSEWSAARVAVTNGVEEDSSLPEAFGVKIMREEVYTPRSK